MAERISKTSVVSASKHQASCDLDDGSAILDLKSGKYFGLNPIGRRIWSFIQTPKPVAEILEEILNEYDVDAETCERDVIQLLEELDQKGPLEIRREESA